MIAGDYGSTTYEMARKTGQHACDPARQPPPLDVIRCMDFKKGKRTRGRPLKSLRNSYWDLLRKLKFDDKDPTLGLKYGELKNIVELICDEPVEFNIRVDCVLHIDIHEKFYEH